MNLGIVILNWNGEELLSRFLPSLIKFTPIKHNIYIIDNGSNDNSIGFVENNYKRIKIIKLDTNHGYAKGYNIGLKKINDEILCLLNNDVEVTENWTDNILKQFDLEPKTAVIQPKLKNYYEKSEFDYAGAAGAHAAAPSPQAGQGHEAGGATAEASLNDPGAEGGAARVPAGCSRCPHRKAPGEA